MISREKFGTEPEISVDDLRAMKASGEEFQLIDVREVDEWDRGYIESAELIPQGEIYDGSSVVKISKDLPVVLYCRSGVRSLHCRDALLALGYSQVVSMAGGIIEWNESK